MKKIVCVCVCVCLFVSRSKEHFRGQKNIFHKNTKISVFTQIHCPLGWVVILWHRSVSSGVKKLFSNKVRKYHFVTFPRLGDDLSYMS